MAWCSLGGLLHAFSFCKITCSWDCVCQMNDPGLDIFLTLGCYLLLPRMTTQLYVGCFVCVLFYLLCDYNLCFVVVRFVYDCLGVVYRFV